MAQKIGEPEPSGDCDVAVGNGAWYELYSGTGISGEGSGVTNPNTRIVLPINTALELRLATSRDEGKTWSITLPVQGTYLHDRGWISMDGPILDITFVPARPNGFNCLDQPPLCEDADQVFFVRSTDGGRSWSRPALAYGDPSQPSAVINGHQVTWDSGAKIAIPLGAVPSASDATSVVEVAHSSDGGSTWSTSVVGAGPATPIVTFPSVALAADGSLVAAFGAGTAKAGSVAIARSTDGGRSWSKPFVLASAAGFDQTATKFKDMIASVGVAVDKHANATVAWMEATNATGTPSWSLHVARVTLGDAPSVTESGVAAPVGHGTPGAFEFLTALSAPDGRALVLYPWNAPGCKQNPPGHESSSRNAECVELLAER